MNFSNYEIKKSIGTGGMATVYLALDKRFQSDVAIKLLNREFVHNENIRKRFLAEARSMFLMSHPNIVRVTDLVDEPEQVAIVMEYVEGTTLKSHIESKGAIPPSQAVAFLRQMLQALNYIHQRKLIHRDIKPSNFMITQEGVIKLLDFGIAKNTDQLANDYTMTVTSQQMGTPLYMSPEQVRSTRDVSAASDLYSLGVVLWQMVSGKKPYDAKTQSVWDIQSKIVNEELAPTQTMLDPIIRKMTAKEVGQRYSSAHSIFQDLDNLSLHPVQPPPAKPVSRPAVQTSEVTLVNTSPFEKPKPTQVTPPPSRSINSRPIVLGGLIGGGVLVIALIVIFLIIKQRSDRSSYAWTEPESSTYETAPAPAPTPSYGTEYPAYADSTKPAESSSGYDEEIVDDTPAEHRIRFRITSDYCGGDLWIDNDYKGYLESPGYLDVYLSEGTYSVVIADPEDRRIEYYNQWITTGSYNDEFELESECACPFVYAYGSGQSSPVFIGEIIRNLRSKELERSDTLIISPELINNDALRLLISEEKDETSYVNELYLLVNGTERIPVESDNQGLVDACSNIDKGYHTLHQGDQISVVFRLSTVQKPIQSLQLISYGYYIPHK